MKIKAGRQKCVLTNFPFVEMLHVCTSSKKEDAEEASFEEKNQNVGFSQGNGGNQNGGPTPSGGEANGSPTLFQLQSTLKTSLGNGQLFLCTNMIIDHDNLNKEGALVLWAMEPWWGRV